MSRVTGIAVVGPPGSGKSTLAAALQRRGLLSTACLLLRKKRAAGVINRENNTPGPQCRPPDTFSGAPRCLRMSKVLCSHCDEPARAFRANPDGTETPFCALHIPHREPRRASGQFRAFISSQCHIPMAADGTQKTG